MLTQGEKVMGSSGGPVTIVEQLGVGGQGIVYEGRRKDGTPVAVKWYLPGSQTPALRDDIADLVARKAPSEHFLWPEELVTKGSDFGYVMPLRPTEFANIPKLLTRQVVTRFRELVRAANQTVSAFKALQSEGLFYCDISDGNLFFDPRTGDILICDNDNVSAGRNAPRVLGTPRYMAPEIVRGETKPSALTDQFSMSVLLFLLLFNDHPLLGKAETDIRCFDAAAMNQLFGTRPVFIFDPADDSNRPVPGVHVNAPVFWELYSPEVKRLFTVAMTDGLREAGKRPSFGEWQKALSELEDSIVYCGCGKQNFYDLAGTATTCWSCRRVVAPPPRLVIDGRRTVMLNHDTALYDHHLARGGGNPGSRGEARAEVAKHPTLEVRGLRNLGAGQWFAKMPSGNAQAVETGRSVTLQPGTEITFGELTGRIEA